MSKKIVQQNEKALFRMPGINAMSGARACHIGYYNRSFTAAEMSFDLTVCNHGDPSWGSN